MTQKIVIVLEIVEKELSDSRNTVFAEWNICIRYEVPITLVCGPQNLSKKLFDVLFVDQSIIASICVAHHIYTALARYTEKYFAVAPLNNDAILIGNLLDCCDNKRVDFSPYPKRI